jgi:hypothetical protein
MMVEELLWIEVFWVFCEAQYSFDYKKGQQLMEMIDLWLDPMRLSITKFGQVL